MIGAFVIACLLSPQASAQGPRNLVFDGTAYFEDVTVSDALPTETGNGDFSTGTGGLGLGQDGYLFAHFDATVPDVNPDPTFNDRDTLPSWFTIGTKAPEDGGGPEYGDAVPVSAVGGQPLWPDFTLPDGTETGASGAWVARIFSLGDGGTDALFNRIDLGPSTPRSFTLHIVTDNTNGEYNTENRIRLRTKDAWDNEIFEQRLRLNPDGNNWNNNIDVYSIDVNNYREGDVIRIQVNPNGAWDPSLAGLMIDVIDPAPWVPEPSTITLGLMGLASVVGFGGRRRR